MTDAHPNGDDYDAYRQRAREWLADNVDRIPHNATAVGQRAGESELEFAARSRELQATLYDAGYAGITLPAAWGGQGLTTRHQQIFDEEVVGYERPGGFGGTFGPILGALLGHMNDEQRSQYLVPILRGTLWCQLMSEPGAAPTSVASPRGRCKTVTSGSSTVRRCGPLPTLSDMAICITRTDWDVPKYSGLTMFIVPMDTPGFHPARCVRSQEKPSSARRSSTTSAFRRATCSVLPAAVGASSDLAHVRARWSRGRRSVGARHQRRESVGLLGRRHRASHRAHRDQRRTRSHRRPAVRDRLAHIHCQQ